MSKNLTRKGLALGAVVALGSSLFAGTPATAAPTALFIQSAFGTSTTGVLGQYFDLATSVTGATSGDTVKYFVEGVAAADVSATARFTTDLTSSATWAATSAAETSVSADLKQTTYSTDGNWTVGSYHQLGIKIDSTNVTATTSIKVTPFLDSVVIDNKPGANELTGTPITINFVKGSEVTATPTITGTTFGSSATASVAVSGGVNVEQFRATANGGHGETPFKVLFSANGTAEVAGATNALWDTTDKVLVASSNVAAAAGTTYGAKAQIVVSASSTVDSASATAVTATAGEVASGGLTAVTVIPGTSVRAAKDASAQKSTDNVVRAGSGTFKVKTTVTAVAGKSKAGQKVTFTIKETDANTLPIGATITAVGGKTLTVASSTVTESITREVVSDADGDATLELSYTGITDAKTFSIEAKANGASAVITSGAKTFTGQDSVATAVVDAIKSASAGTPVRRIAKGGSASVALTVVDQFGQVPTGTFRVVVTQSNVSGTAVAPSFTYANAVSNGAVTVTINDNSTADQQYDVTSTLQKLGSDGTTYSNLAVSKAAVSRISVGTVSTVSTLAVSATKTTGVDRSGEDLVAGNTDAQQNSVAHAGTTDTTLTVTATDSTGANVPGAQVTFSAPGVLFQAGNTYGLGSLTVVTDANGATGNVLVYSNNVGKTTVTVTSGSATKTQLLTFDTPTTGGAKWEITAPASILPGQTLKVSAVLKDKFGFAVDTAATVGASVKPVAVVYTGPGYVTTTIASETDEDGVVSFTVLLGSADAGTATVKFTYAGANNEIAETTLNDDVVATASILIGKAAPATSAATAAVSGSTGKFYVSATNAAAKKVVVKVAGKFFRSFTGTAAKKTVALKAPKGKHKVTVFVGGKLVTTKTITVK